MGKSDLLIIIGKDLYDFQFPHNDVLKEYGIGLIWLLEEDKVRDLKIGKDADEYIHQLHEQIHKILEIK